VVPLLTLAALVVPLLTLAALVVPLLTLAALVALLLPNLYADQTPAKQLGK